MSQIDDNTGFNEKIRPEWGLTAYKKQGCTSYRVVDDIVHQKMLDLIARGTVKLREARFVLKLNRTSCLNCLHLSTGGCPYSEEEIKSVVAKYKKTTLRCHHCGTVVINFHFFLLQGMAGANTFTCEVCQQAEKTGDLPEQLRTQQKENRVTRDMQISEVIFLFLLLLLKISYDFYHDSALGQIIFFIVAGAFFLDFVVFLGFFIKSMWGNKKKKENEKLNS
jgi:hypothetical protein